MSTTDPSNASSAFSTLVAKPDAVMNASAGGAATSAGGGSIGRGACGGCAPVTIVNAATNDKKIADTRARLFMTESAAAFAGEVLTERL